MYMYLILRFFNLLLAGIFLASCVAIERNNPDDPGSADYVPNSAPSSNSKPSSSSQTGIIPGIPVYYEGETYNTVVIGSQTWMARNLNYDVSGSKCYNDQESYCTTYGRLYNWDMAMTVCPDGWHLPSGKDWNVLMKFLRPNCSDYEPCNKAGTRLKATSGWEVVRGIPPGTDDFGFKALPGGGLGYPNMNLDDAFEIIDEVGYFGIWWSNTESSTHDAYARYMFYNTENVGWDYADKSYAFYSVRCVKD